MRTVVFLGPTLPFHRAVSVLGSTEVDWRPPACRGDIYKAVQDGAQAIALIDGYFGILPAVSHKEILWGISRGVRVLGAASMGALRAVELRDFGMAGVGWVYRNFLTGRLHRDDEVAVEHGPATVLFAPTSLPLVNIRCTVARAVRNKDVSADFGQLIIQAASELYFGARNWQTIIQAALGPRRLSNEEHAAFEAIKSAYIDRKSLDAILALKKVGDPIWRQTRNPQFNFEDTVHFSQFRRRIDNPFTTNLA